MSDLVGVADVRSAAVLLEGFAEVTPLAHSRWLHDLTGAPVHLKCENLQRTGSFKVRGAYTRISGLTAEERSHGVVAASAGNHAQGVALAAQRLGCVATIFMPNGAALPKVQATRSYGADVRFAGNDVTAALAAATDFAARTGAMMIHPFDHRDVIAGQGTVGLEIVRQRPEVDTIVVPLGGGGLLAGVALAKRDRPDLRVIGVQAGAAAAWPVCLREGAPREVHLDPTMADGIAVGRPGDAPFQLIRELVDDVLTVGEDALSRALVALLERAKLLVEPAGAAAVAAVVAHPEQFTGDTVAVVSGGNIDALLLLEVIRNGLASAGRFMMFRVRITDRPGELMRLLAELARMDVNVLNVHHDRGSEALGVRQVEVQLQVATRGPEHRERVRAELGQLGWELV